MIIVASTTHKLQRSPTFLKSPVRCLEKVTSKDFFFLIFLILIFLRPIPYLFSMLTTMKEDEEDDHNCFASIPFLLWTYIGRFEYIRHTFEEDLNKHYNDSFFAFGFLAIFCH